MITISTVEVRTLAGSVWGWLDGIGTNAKFRLPYTSVVSRDGTYLLLSDFYDHRIRKIVISTQQVTTFLGSGLAGTSNGVGTNAQLSSPIGLSLPVDESYCLISTFSDRLIRKADMKSLQLITVAGQAGECGFVDGIGTNARFCGIHDLKQFIDDSYVILIEYSYSAIRKLVLSTYEVSTIFGSPPGYGDGSGTNARFNTPSVLSLSPSGSYGFLTDMGNNRLRRINFVGK